MNCFDSLQSTFTQQDTRPSPDKNGGKEGTFLRFKDPDPPPAFTIPDPDTLIHREEYPVYNCSTKFYDILIDKERQDRTCE
jgi:hypothetical protein